MLGSGIRGDGVVRAAEQKLELLGLSHAQIQQIADRGEPIEKVPFVAPASGSVIEKNVVEGDAVQAGQRLFRIAALDKVWVEADLFEADLQRVEVGMPATVTLGAATGQDPDRHGHVHLSVPRSADPHRARADRATEPGPRAPPRHVRDRQRRRAARRPRCQVPTAAIVYTGPRRLVYVELGGGQLRAQEVKLGARSGDRTEITSGLEPGELVVTSGNFLVAAESRLRAPEGQP